MRVILRVRAGGQGSINLSNLQPDALLSLSSREIANLHIPNGEPQADLGLFFHISRVLSAPDSLVLIDGSCQVTHVGSKMTSGLMIVDGDTGDYAGSGMQGGTLVINGCAGDCLGVAMDGGTIRVTGNAGDWCGAANAGVRVGMRGGTILVMGSVGMETGSLMRRGLIAVAGDCGESAAAGMLAGTVLCLGNLDKHAGIGMKRGSILSETAKSILPGFRPAGDGDIGWLRLLHGWLQELKFPIPGRWWQSNPARWTGDHLELGKGELIIHDCIE